MGAGGKETERAELHKTIWRIANDLQAVATHQAVAGPDQGQLRHFRLVPNAVQGYPLIGADPRMAGFYIAGFVMFPIAGTSRC